MRVLAAGDGNCPRVVLFLCTVEQGADRRALGLRTGPVSFSKCLKTFTKLGLNRCVQKGGSNLFVRWTRAGVGH